jgi:hypothetical protein
MAIAQLSEEQLASIIAAGIEARIKTLILDAVRASIGKEAERIIADVQKILEEQAALAAREVTTSVQMAHSPVMDEIQLHVAFNNQAIFKGKP